MGNRTGLPALCSTVAGLTLTGIMADSHHTWEVGRNEKEKETGKLEEWAESARFCCWFVSTNAGLHSEKTSTLSVWSNVKVRPTLCSGWCNCDMTWTDSPWVIRVFECQAVAVFFFKLGYLYAIWTHWVAADDSSCCHSVSSWVERRSTLDISCCPLLMCLADRIRPPLLQLLSDASTAHTSGHDIPFSCVTTWMEIWWRVYWEEMSTGAFISIGCIHQNSKIKYKMAA